jgi:F-type H+-transporting ATPase subunit b
MRSLNNRLIRLALPLLAVLLAAGVAAAAEEGKESSVPYYGDLGQTIATVLIFIALLVILGRYAWTPIVTQLKKREDDIARTIDEAQKRQKEAEELLASYKAQLASAEAEARALIADARKDAAEAREQLLAAAREESHRINEQTRSEVGQAKQAALRDIYDTAADLAVNVAGQVLRKKLTPQDQQELLRQSLEEVRQYAAAAK